jgi:hypothetical protein
VAIILSLNQPLAATAPQQVAYRIFITSDYNTTTAPSTVGEITSRTHKQVTMTYAKPEYRWNLKPRTLTSTGQMLPTGQWIDTVSSGVAHYGALAWISGYNTTGPAPCDIVYTEELELEFRAVK